MIWFCRVRLPCDQPTPSRSPSGRALALITEAERARDAVRRARQKLDEHGRELDRAADELVSQGLTSEQVCRLLELTDEEAPDRGARHRSISTADPSAD